MSTPHISNMHHRNSTQFESQQRTARNHYNTILNALPSSITGYAYTIFFYVHPILPVLGVNWLVGTENEVKFRQQDRELAHLLKQQSRGGTSSGIIGKRLFSVLTLVVFALGSLLLGGEL